MGGFSVISGNGLGSVMNADNVSFDGTSQGGVVTTNGQILIGSTATPHIRVGTLTPGSGISITNGPGTITIANSGALTDLHTARFIVGTASNGSNFTTIASAIAAASSGDTIYIQTGTYTENLTLPAGIDLCAFECDAQTPNVTIIGKITATSAGTRTISGIRLQTNSDNFLVVSGSAATIVNLFNCYLNASNATGMVLSSSGGAVVNMYYCKGDLGTTGIKFFDLSNDGSGFNMDYCLISNSGSSLTASTASAGVFSISYSDFNGSITTSGTTAGFTITHSSINIGGLNTTCITHGSTNASGSNITFSFLSSGTASAISVGANATLNCQNCILTSSNTNVITGSGTLNFGNVGFGGTSSVINTTTQAGRYVNLGKYKASFQPAFSAYLASVATDVTGDGTNYQLGTNALTELFDIGDNFNTNGTFTAPVSGYYQFNCCILAQGVSATNTAVLSLGTSVAPFTFGNFGTCATGNMPMAFSVLAQMQAGDTAVVNLNFSNGAKTVDIYGANGDVRTFFQGWLVA
jgi:hypothetical protein